MRTTRDREEVIDQLWQKGVRDIFDIARVCSHEPAFSDFNPGATVIFITTHLGAKKLKATVRHHREPIVHQMHMEG